MDSKQYIKRKLDELVINFPYIKVKYEADLINHCHLIDVTPLSFYQNEIYQAAEDIITLDFIDKYPIENIVFISENSETKLTKVDYEVFGRMFYVNPVTMLHQSVIAHCNLHYADSIEASDIFKTLEPNYLELTSNLFINSLPAVHPYLSGINYSSSYYTVLDYSRIANVSTVSACLTIKKTQKDDLTTLAA